MMALAMLWLAATAVPGVTAGPDLAEGAAVIEAPVSEVTVYSDRARVRRRAEADLKEGVRTLRLPDLPGAVFLDTVRLSCSEGKVLRVEATPVERERFSIDQVEALIDRLEALTDQLAASDGESLVVQLELSLLAQVLPAAPVPENKRVGQPLPQVLPELWKQVLDFLGERRNADRAKLRALAVARRDLEEKLILVQREVGRYNLGAFTDHRVQVVAIVEAPKAGRAKLELEYFLPGASWWPAYDIRFDAEKGVVAFHTAGLVQQATGEDWNDVTLKLSTAIPGQGIDLPALLTWALGEKREFIPQAVAARTPPVAERFGAPAPQPTSFDSERQAKLQLLAQRLQELRGLSTRDARGPMGGETVAMGKPTEMYKKKTIVNFEDDSISGELVRPDGEYVSERKRAQLGHRGKAEVAKPMPAKQMPPPAPPPSRPMAGGAAPEPVMAEEAESLSVRAAAISGGGGGSSDRGERVVETSLGLFEPLFYQPPQFADRNLPAVVAGGLDYVYTSPTRATIPSSGKHLHIPLSIEVYPVKSFYEATPSLMTTAFLKATVVNRSERPILQGPVNIFVGNDFAGQGSLKTTGPGGTVEFPLGADEDIRLLRRVVPSTEVKGLIKKDEVTTYAVTIEVGNYKKQPARVGIIDQVPKSNNEDIEIELLKVNPRQFKGPDEDGVVRWELDIPAGKTQTVEFGYRVTRPKDWQLYQQ